MNRTKTGPRLLLAILFVEFFGFSHAAWAEDRADDGAPEVIRVVVTELSVRGGIDPADVEGIDMLLGPAFAGHPDLKAIFPTDIRNLLDLEAQKMLMGCEESNCMVALGGALGASYVMTPALSFVSGRFVVQITLIDAEDATVVHRATRTITDFAKLPEAFEEAGTEAVNALSQTGPWWTGVGIGGGTFLGGAALALVSDVMIYRHNAAVNANSGPGERLTRNQANTARVGRIVGDGLMIAGAGFALFSYMRKVVRPGTALDTTVTLLPTDGGALLAIGGRF